MSTPTPVLFIHGLWLHATSWQPWVDLFADNGYAPVAPGWPGEPDTVAEAREHPELVANVGIADAAEHFAQIAAGLGCQADPHRSLLRRPAHREAAR